MNFNGSESVPDLNLATILAFDDNTVPIKNSWIAEWRYPSGVVTRRIANRQGKTNIIFKMKLESVPAGDPCTVCWGIDKPFGGGQTPETVTVVIEGIGKGPDWIPLFGEPPNGTFELTQIVGIPCSFGGGDAEHRITFRFGPTESFIEINQVPIGFRQFIANNDICSTFFESISNNPFDGGTATIFVPPAR